MQVLHVIQRYWPYIGGSERHLQEISERLAREGHTVRLYTTDALDLELFWNPAKQRIRPQQEIHAGVEITRFPVRHLPLSRRFYPGVRRIMATVSSLPFDTAPLLALASGLAPLVPELGRALARTEPPPDIVHGMNICFESLLYPALRAARRAGAAFVVTPLTHLGETSDDSIRKYYTMQHQLALLAQSDAVLVQTDIEREFLARQGVSLNRLVKAGVGVNPAEVLGGDGQRFRQKYAIQGPIVFSVGMAAYDKGTLHLVEAMRSLWARGSDACLVLAGPMMDAFSRYLDRLPVTNRQRVHTLGFIPEEDKKDLFAAGQVLAMPSRTDSFGIVYLEAWLYGKPVIGAWAGGVPEVIADGADGYLVRFGAVQELAERLAQLLADQELAGRLGERGRQKVLARYTWDRVYPVVREVYERLCWQKKRAPEPVRQWT